MSADICEIYDPDVCETYDPDIGDILIKFINDFMT